MRMGLYLWVIGYIGWGKQAAVLQLGFIQSTYCNKASALLTPEFSLHLFKFQSFFWPHVHMLTINKTTKDRH